MKKLILIIAIVSICTLLFADSIRKNKKYGVTGLVEYKAKTPRELIDSLEAELANAQEDTNKVNILNNIAFNLRNNKPDECINRAEQALSLSEKLNWKKGQANSFNIIGIGNTSKGQYEPALSFLTKSLKIAEEINDKQSISSVLGNLGSVYNYQSNYAKALEYYEKSLIIAEEINNKQLISSVLGNIGNVYGDQSNYAKALEYNKKALQIAEETGNIIGITNKLGNIGNIYYDQSNYPNALEYFEKGLRIVEELGYKASIGKYLANIGNVYNNQSNYAKALEYYEKALNIAEEQGNKASIGILLGNIGNVYRTQSNFTKALEYYEKALRIAEKLGDKNSIGRHFGNIGIVYLALPNYAKALEYFEKAMKIAEEIGDKASIGLWLGNIGNVYNKQSNYAKSLEYYEKALKIAEEIGDKSRIYLHYMNKGNLYLNIAYDSTIKHTDSSKKENLKLAMGNSLKALAGFKELKEDDNIRHSEKNISEIYELMDNHKEALEHFKKSQELKDSIFSSDTKVKIANLEAQRELEVKNKELALKAKENELLFANNTNQTLALEKQRQQVALLNSQQSLQRLELEKRQNQLSLLQKDKTLAELNIRNKEAEAKSNAQEIKLLQINQKNQENEIKTKNYQLYLSIFGIMSVLFVAFIVYRERKKSEDLLLNILPATIAKRLKAKEQPIADHFDSASVMFIDIVGFTQMSANEDPKRIVVALNEVFTKFDKLADKHGLEKIKTIGDSYMVAAGIPIIQPDHALRACNMAMDVKREMKDYTIGTSKIEFRIGIDCGAVVAGVIGEKKFIYDLWSDAVNTASRMESTGVAGEIHISDNFKNELEKQSNNFKFQARETIEVKGKGQMQTWFVG